ncbi:Embryonic stem cell-specific 5-hydroxymethylcytosine-binding protein [Schistosoma japonicum]|nr:Embryonic stem cell-specific 5-hydroxymethylcytosine-binding protein [Schistosoma japonicum]KAH8866588.1 Embryonic stem cell-specific 5-hydroxymethylcytosine-binding protein [Schistosoma japonicum]
MHWGLIPAFIHGDSTSTFHTFNARIESLLEKRSYKCSLQEGKRCVVVVQGCYFQIRDPYYLSVIISKETYFLVDFMNGKLQARRNNHFISALQVTMPLFLRKSLLIIGDPEKLLMMAGLFAYNYEKQMYSYTIVTTSSKGIMTDVHTRMPVTMYNDDDVYEWLDPAECNYKQAYEFLVNLTQNLDNAPMVKYPVTYQVNNSKYNQPNCIKPTSEEEERKITAKAHGSPHIMMKFFKRSDKDDTTSCKINNEKTIQHHSQLNASCRNVDEIKKDELNQ